MAKPIWLRVYDFARNLLRDTIIILATYMLIIVWTVAILPITAHALQDSPAGWGLFGIMFGGAGLVSWYFYPTRLLYRGAFRTQEAAALFGFWMSIVVLGSGIIMLLYSISPYAVEPFGVWTILESAGVFWRDLVVALLL